MQTARWTRKAVLMMAVVTALAWPGVRDAATRESQDDHRVVIRDVVRDIHREVIRDVMRDVRRDIRRDVSQSLREVRELCRLVHEDLRALHDLQLEYAEPAELRATLDRLHQRLRELEVRLEAEGWR